jgi:hypothetical protein
VLYVDVSSPRAESASELSPFTVGSSGIVVVSMLLCNRCDVAKRIMQATRCFGMEQLYSLMSN